MNEQDLEQIGEMIKSVMDARLQQFRGEVKDDLHQFRDEIISRTSLSPYSASLETN